MILIDFTIAKILTILLLSKKIYDFFQNMIIIELVIFFRWM